MFERYSDTAQSVVAVAEDEARHLGHPHVGTEHLLLGLVSDRHNAVTRSLPPGTTLDVVRRKVAEAVGTNGSATEDVLALSPRARRALDRASRFSVQQHDAQVQVKHVLLGMLDVEGRAGQVLRGLGVDIGKLREAADRTATESPATRQVDPAPQRERPSPRCATCGAALDTELSWKVLTGRGENDDLARFVVAYCSACGSSLGVLPERPRR